MSTETLTVSDGQVIEGYDHFTDTAAEWCTPIVAGCGLCVGVSATGRTAILTITLRTPWGSYTRNFHVGNNVCFTFQPIGQAKAELCVTDYRIVGSQLCFTLSVTFYIKLPVFGWKRLFGVSKQLCVPIRIPGAATFNAVGIDDTQFATLLLLHNSLGEDNDESKCNCH